MQIVLNGPIRLIFFQQCFGTFDSCHGLNKTLTMLCHGLNFPFWSGPGQRRLRGKQTPITDFTQASQKRVVVSHKASTQSVQWEPQEQDELNKASDWRARQRVEKRLLHNRTAEQLGKHILAPFQQNQTLCCIVCCKTTGHSNLSKFLRELCGGPHEHDVADSLRAARPSVKLAQRANTVQTHNQQVYADKSNLHVFRIPSSLTDELSCEVCNATITEGWRRFGKFARRTCPLSTL